MVRGVVTLVLLGGCRQLLGLDDPVRGDAAAGLQPDVAIAIDGAQRDCNSEWRAGTIRFGAAAQITELESTSSQRDPWLPANELAIYFNSDRGTQNGLTAIYTATRSSVSEAFTNVQLETDLESGMGESKVSLTGDGLMALFASTRTGEGSSDIWQATRTTTAMQFGTAIETTLLAIDDPNAQYDPQISGDGLTLYYSTLTNGGGGQLIGFAQRAARTAGFSNVTLLSLGGGNGAADPYPSADGSFIVFSSLQPTNAALGVNLWYALSDGTTVLVPDVNTDTDEGDPWLSADGCRLYFSRDRMRGNSPYDLYFTTAL